MHRTVLLAITLVALPLFAWALFRPAERGDAHVDPVAHLDTLDAQLAEYDEQLSAMVGEQAEYLSDLAMVAEGGSRISSRSLDRVDSVGTNVRGADDEWSSFERTSWNFATRVVTNPSLRKPSELFRNTQLNPQDTYIPPVLRQELHLIHELASGTLAAIATMRRGSQRAEVQKAILSGRVAISEYKVSPSGIRKIVFRDLDSVVHEAHGQVYTIAKEEFPITLKIREYESYIGRQYGIAIVTWFSERGICPEPERLVYAIVGH